MKRPLVIAFTLVALASCSRANLVIVPRADLPHDLYGSRVRNSSPNVATVRLFMVQGTRLVAVDRRGRSSLPLPTLAMTELLKGPTHPEMTRGTTTNIPNTVSLLDVSVQNQIATVNLSHDFELTTPDRPTFELRLAQVVYTLTELAPTVQSVRFEVEGQPVSVLVQDGSLVSEPVARGRYTLYAPVSSGAAVSTGPLA